MIQSVSIRFGDATAVLHRGKEPNVHLVTPSGATLAEVSWPLWGRHVLLRNTALGRPVQAVTGDLLVEALHAGGSSEVVHAGTVRLEWLTGRPIALAPPSIDVLPVFADFCAYYAGNGPPHEQVPTDVLLAQTSVRPFPDPNVTSSTGSGRLAAVRLRAAVAALLLHERGVAPAPELLEDFERDVVRQWARGCHPDLPGEDDPATAAALGYRPWYALENANWICSGGYSKSPTARGGFHALYSHALPPGVDFEGSGDLDCDMQHFAIDQQILAGVLTRNVPAMLDAFGAIQSAMSLLPHEGDALGRGRGHLLRACALWHHAFAGLLPSLGAVVAANISEILGQLEAHAHDGPERVGEALYPGVQRRAQVLDFGSSTDSYHMPQESVGQVLALLGADTPTNRKAAARSGSSWGHGIIVVGCDEVLSAPYLPESTKAKARAVLERCAHFLLVHASASAFKVAKDGALLGFTAPSAPGFWDDVSLFEAPGLPDIPAPLGQGSVGESGIWARFLHAPLRIIARRLGLPRARELADSGLAWCNARGNWNGDYWRWLLESGWEAGADHGRADVRDV